MGGGGAPKPTAEQKAMERAQREQLNKETASSEARLKAMAQKKIGKASLLGTPVEQAKGPDGPTITPGYQLRNGKIRKIPKAKGVFSKLFGSTLIGATPTGQGIKGAPLIGKGAEKAVKGVKK